MSGFRCLREIESALFNCWDRGFLSPGTLLPVGHDVGFEKDFVDFAKLRFLRQPRLPDFLWQLLQPWASKFALLGNQPWWTMMAMVFDPVSVIYVIQYFILNLPTPVALSIQPIIITKRIPRCISNSKHCSVCHGSYKLWSNPVNSLKFGSQQDKSQAVQIGKKIFKSKFCDRQRLVLGFKKSIISLKSRKSTLHYVFFGLGSTLEENFGKRSLSKTLK